MATHRKDPLMISHVFGHFDHPSFEAILPTLIWDVINGRSHIKINWPVLVKVEKRQIQNNNEMEKICSPKLQNVMTFATMTC